MPGLVTSWSPPVAAWCEPGDAATKFSDPEPGVGEGDTRPLPDRATLGDVDLACDRPGGRAAVEAAGRLALFDLDRTLLRDSSLATVALVAWRHDLVSFRRVARGLADNVRYARHGESGSMASHALDAVLATVAGRTVDDLVQVVDDALDRLERRVRPEMRAALQTHLDLGDRVVVLSASPQELVDALARRLGAERGIGTQGEILDGVCTGRLDGPFCHGQGKLVRLRHELGDVDLSEAWCYADSMSDLPLMALTGHPVAVSPDDRLRAEATRRDWAIAG